ncbi:MAG: HSP20 family [Geobacteraceae bacterium]|nr:MAG: HSP20 family [Geobacteraceae bacterium]
MRRQAELRTIRETPERTSVKSAPSGTRETLPATTFERNILSTLHDMERMMEETFHRPFFSMTPFRHLLHEFGSFGEVTPTIDVFEQGNEVVVKSEIPGIKREDVNLKVVDNNLIISGEKKTEEKVERKDYLRVERSHGTFNRTISLPEGCDFDHIKANYKDGVLEVRIPKVEGKGVEKQIKVE